jgi:hypothetical protein
MDAGPLPLRPVTVGELLDAAVMLVRAHAAVLIPLAGVLALAEQVLLAPVRAWAGIGPLGVWPTYTLFGRWWLLVALGAGLEALIIALLAGPAARAAGSLLLGHRLATRRLLNPQGSRGGAVLLVALVAGALTALGALAGPFWALTYATTALAVPALILDRVGPGRALARGARMVWRVGGRPFGVVLLGYLGWSLVRLVIGAGGPAALGSLPLDPSWIEPIGLTLRTSVNALAYATLAALVAVLHLETRMRCEGLDLLIARASSRGPVTADLLTEPRA